MQQLDTEHYAFNTCFRDILFYNFVVQTGNWPENAWLRNGIVYIETRATEVA